MIAQPEMGLQPLTQKNAALSLYGYSFYYYRDPMFQ